MSTTARQRSTKRPNPKTKPLFPGNYNHPIPQKMRGFVAESAKPTKGAFGGRTVYTRAAAKRALQ